MPMGTRYMARINRCAIAHGQQQHTTAHSPAVSPILLPRRRTFLTLFSVAAIAIKSGCRHLTDADGDSTVIVSDI
ncbi:hypothetical protein OROMI_008955 [Orobanche minor]